MPARDIPQDGIELIKSFEGLPDGDTSTANLDAYLDPVGIWTIGWGHAITVDGAFLRGSQNLAQARALYPGGLTLAQAEALLRDDLAGAANDVLAMVTADIDDGQYGALVSFAFNAGSNNLRQSTLLRKLNAGDYAGAADQFLLWNKARQNGVLVELAGLTRRRRTERALFLGQDWRAAAATRSREVAMGSGRPEVPEGDHIVAATVATPAPVRTRARASTAQAVKTAKAEAVKAAKKTSARKTTTPAKAPARTTKATTRPPAPPAARRAPRRTP